MNRFFILLFSLLNAVLYFILYYNLYKGPRSNDAGIIFIILAFMLACNAVLLNVITLLTSALKKDFKWTVVKFCALAFITFELLTLVFFKQPVLFGLFGEETLSFKNMAFIYSLCNVISLVSLGLLFMPLNYVYNEKRQASQAS